MLTIIRNDPNYNSEDEKTVEKNSLHKEHNSYNDNEDQITEEFEAKETITDENGNDFILLVGRNSIFIENKLTEKNKQYNFPLYGPSELCTCFIYALFYEDNNTIEIEIDPEEWIENPPNKLDIYNNDGKIINSNINTPEVPNEDDFGVFILKFVLRKSINPKKSSYFILWNDGEVQNS